MAREGRLPAGEGTDDLGAWLRFCCGNRSASAEVRTASTRSEGRRRRRPDARLPPPPGCSHRVNLATTPDPGSCSSRVNSAGTGPPPSRGSIAGPSGPRPSPDLPASPAVRGNRENGRFLAGGKKPERSIIGCSWAGIVRQPFVLPGVRIGSGLGAGVPPPPRDAPRERALPSTSSPPPSGRNGGYFRFLRKSFCEKIQILLPRPKAQIPK